MGFGKREMSLLVSISWIPVDKFKLESGNLKTPWVFVAAIIKLSLSSKSKIVKSVKPELIAVQLLPLSVE